MHHKILIIDDDPGVCNSLAMLLRGEKYHVDNTMDSGEGVTLIKKNEYDLCLFDYKMKGLNGIDLLRILKGVNPRCPVFIISAMSNIEALCRKEIKAGLLAGIISKPFDVEALLKRIVVVVQ